MCGEGVGGIRRWRVISYFFLFSWVVSTNDCVVLVSEVQIQSSVSDLVRALQAVGDGGQEGLLAGHDLLFAVGVGLLAVVLACVNVGGQCLGGGVE